MTIPTIKRRDLGGYEEITCNPVVIEIRNTHSINYSSTGYIYTWISIERGAGTLEIVITILFCRIYCNIQIILVNSLLLP